MKIRKCGPCRARPDSSPPDSGPRVQAPACLPAAGSKELRIWVLLAALAATVGHRESTLKAKLLIRNVAFSKQHNMQLWKK